MTNDEFVVAVVGAPWVTGDGNHFRQSYPMQLHRVLAPVLARLGVQLVTRNLSSRYAGSVPAGLGKLWGTDTNVDLLIWDQGETERSRREKDLFLRQALLSGKEKIPVVWMGGSESDWELLRLYHEQADVDVGRFGTALYGIPVVTGDDMVNTIPHAARYLHCDPKALGVCRQAPDEYCATCWIDRPDIADPKTLFPNITDTVPNQRNWNPGWRAHQLTGRLLAYSVLDALQDALQTFTAGTGGGPPLDEEDWHMSAYYENMRSKLANMKPIESGCEDWENVFPARLCTTALQGATQHTPRAGASIAEIIKPGPSGIPTNPQKVMYENYDVHNSCFDPQGDGVPNIVGVVSARRRHLLGLDTAFYEDEHLLQDMPPAFARVHAARMADQQAELQKKQQQQQRRQQSSDGSLIQTGAGWRIVDESPGQCDGAYTSICGREASSTCPLLGHHDSPGQIQGDESAGWLVLELENLEHGLVILGVRLGERTSIQRRRRRLRSETNPIAALPDSMVMDVSINGQVTTWNKQEVEQRLRFEVQRGFDALVLLDDESFLPSGPSVEVGIRIRECGSCTLGITHVFWA